MAYAHAVYPLRLRDALTGKWYRTRWKASLDEIAKLGGVVDGDPEMRGASGDWGTGFNPSRQQPRASPRDSLDLSPPHMDDTERYLARLFLRPYVTYCTRRGRFAQAGGAAALWSEL